jgi:hypothetical protein
LTPSLSEWSHEARRGSNVLTTLTTPDLYSVWLHLEGFAMPSARHSGSFALALARM